MAPINNLRRRPGGQILYSRFYFDALIDVLVSFCLRNCERMAIGLCFPLAFSYCSYMLLFKIEIEY